MTGDWQKHKGLPGTEGTLKVAAPKPHKSVAYEAAVKAAAAEPAEGATTMKKKAQDKLAAKAAPAVETPVVAEAPAAETAEVSEPAAVATESEVPAVEATTEDVVVAETTNEETPSAK